MRCLFYNIKWGRGGVGFGYKHPFFIYKFQNRILKFYNRNPFIDYPALQGFFAEHQVNKGDTLIDVGAYAGLMSIISSFRVGKKGKVIAIEADPQNYSLLRKNVLTNGIKNITLINKAVWSKKRKLKWYSGQDYNSNLFQKQNKFINIQASTLDDELKKRKISKVNMIIMDVEGAEIEAIKGSNKTLEGNNVNLAIASYHVLNDQPTWIELEKLLSKMGYTAHTSFESHLTTYAQKEN